MKALFTTESLFALAAKWAANNPELTARLARAHVLVLRNAVRAAGDGEFYVDATKGNVTGRDSELYSVDIQAVPEPASMAALMVGAAALVRKRKK